MQYAVWFVRLVYAAWMIPAGLNHFTRLYPQPTGNQPISIEVFTALLDSGLFTLVKATELLAGVAVLLGFRLPLMLLAVLPVSFTVWYWDTELQGWWTGSAVYGWAVLSCNVLLCLAYWPSYRPIARVPAAWRCPWGYPRGPKLRSPRTSWLPRVTG